uniref:Uncharacterized protein n=1 Tax=Anguilla anguilla TaxID=7936 RepID=A0A0E9PV14_ANGAN
MGGASMCLIGPLTQKYQKSTNRNAFAACSKNSQEIANFIDTP